MTAELLATLGNAEVRRMPQTRGHTWADANWATEHQDRPAVAEWICNVLNRDDALVAE